MCFKRGIFCHMGVNFFNRYSQDFMMSAKMILPYAFQHVQYLYSPVCVYYSQTSEEVDGMEAA